MPTSNELLERMRKDKPKPPAKLCGYMKWLSTQDASIQEALTLAADDPDVAIAAMFRFVREQGFMGSLSTLKAHTQGSCPCSKIGLQ